MFFTISNVQAPFLQPEGLINGVNDEKSMLDDFIKFNVVCPLYHNAFIRKWIVHQCDVKGCKENLVIDRSFDNNMECCMAKERLVGTVHWADEERNEGWEPEGNVPPLLHYRFAKGEREKMVA
ncbi:hypothetical protein P5673_029592 [Acropora cervicornis]|uniref:Uncharacterized protein n=1 Tax=Acropora cervicornis TaxID=6130 RepID=A0AAD9PVV0_ACRCE|nr:hypothetical protein P5673_029592 [Acropora cervicornis]